MNPDRQQAVEYLRAHAGGIWRWTENGTVLAWRDGSTIAFREEIVQIIEWLAPNGLPPFGSIVFLLAACRGKVPEVYDVATISSTPLPPIAGKDAAVLMTARMQLQAQLAAALAQLKKVSELPSELNSGIKAKCVLAEAVFEPAKVERHVDARAVLRGLSEPMNDSELIDPERPAVSGGYIRQVHIVSEGLKRHTPETLALRLRTGLDALPKDVDANLPMAERARRLIEELSRDHEYGPVARAARELMAAVRLPRRLGEREQLAIGGVSDITNRGPLDRLLLSELAHDDLTLSVRIALNEALYLRREPPMREPPGTLALLLDSGVRLWGVPRVLATAVALALIARDKQHGEVVAWRSRGKQLQPVDFLSRLGLTQHLGALEPNAHAGECLPAFVEAISANARNQSVLITHRDALADPEFRRALADNPGAPGFIATVDREGRFELHALPLAHRPPICEADLDLEQVFDRRVPIPPIKPELDPNLPAIFGVSPFPFLLPLAGRADFWIKSSDGWFYALLNDRRLVRFGKSLSGAKVLASDLPGGTTLWMECDGETVHLVRRGSAQRPARLISVPASGGEPRVSDLVSGSEVLAAHRYGDAIILIRRHDVRACSLSDGRMLAHTVNPHRTWLKGRFFKGTSQFYFAVWDGERVKFEPVHLPTQILFSSVLTIFDRPGVEGPWLMLQQGQLVSISSGAKIRAPVPADAGLDFDQAHVSLDGDQLLVRSTRRSKDTNKVQAFVYGMKQNQATIDVVDLPCPFFDRPPLLPTWNIYRIVESVVLYQGGIALCGRKNRWRKLGLDEDGKFRIAPLTPENISPTRQFWEPPRKTRHGCTLQVMAIGRDRKVFLDSRGLLHFKSAELTLPEVSIVLADGEVAGWTSDGYMCGPSFFFDEPYRSEPEHVFARMMKFFDGL